MRPYLKRSKKEIADAVRKNVAQELDHFITGHKLDDNGIATKMMDAVERAIIVSMDTLLNSLGNEDDIDDTILK